LLDKGYHVYGTYRRTSTPNFWRLQTLDVFSKIDLIPADLLDMGSMMEAVKVSDPDEIYNLAASSFVGTAFEQPVGNTEITATAVTKLLETIRFLNPNCKFYQASSSEMYGNSDTDSQNESTIFKPSSPYAVSKLYAHWMTSIYRKSYDMFASTGILFNHESPLRGLEFVTRKITNAVVRIKLGLQKELRLGNLDSFRDWGYAPEYVEGMWKILQHKKPDDFVLATGESHSVREFVQEAFSLLDLDWKKYVKSDKRYYRVLEVKTLNGDSTKARRILKWKPKTKFKELVKMMVTEDLKRWEGWQKGERFPWDAANYIGDDKILFRTNKR
jgi:GDPmannose 4,6-dehydratase